MHSNMFYIVWLVFFAAPTLARRCSLFDEGNATLSGFTAEISSTRSLGDQTSIAFDEVLIDQGDDFTPLLGTFTCPDYGIYAFFWTIGASQGRVSAELVMDGEPVKFGPLTREVPGSFSGTSSMGTVTQCFTGSMVWLKAVTWPNATTCNYIEEDFSSFTGFKIFEEEDGDASAFTAELSANSTERDIIYDRVLFDVGSDYNSFSGEYVCPQSGIYVFMATNHISIDANLHDLRMNGNELTGLTVTYNTDHWRDDSGTSAGVAVIECAQNDVITIRSAYGGVKIATLTSFTGFLLSAGDESIAFMARLSSRTEYLDGRTIIFDDVLTNVGDRYAPTPGMFGCPDDDTDDLFFLTWTVWTRDYDGNHPAQARLMTTKGGEVTVEKEGPRSCPAGSDASPTVSTQAVVQCERGRAFYVQSVIETGGPLTFWEEYSYFAGFRLPKFT